MKIEVEVKHPGDGLASKPLEGQWCYSLEGMPVYGESPQREKAVVPS